MPDATLPQLDSLLEHRSWVRDLARRLVRDAADAEDLAQEVWVRVMRSPPDPDRDPRPWLRRVLKNLAINRWRGEGRRTVRELAWRDTRSQRTPAELVEEADQHQRLVRRVLSLEEPFRTTLVLRFYEGLAPREIAERMGIAEGTVHSRVARAVARLRDRFDEEEGGDRKRWIAALLPLARGGVHATTTATTATALSGVLLMITNTKLTALTALGLVLLVAGGAWMATSTDGDVPEAERVAPAVRGEQATLKGQEAGLRAAAPTGTGSGAQGPAAMPTVQGRVLDAEGAPLAGVEVFVLPAGVDGVHADELADARLLLTRTDADGVFRLASKPREGTLVALAKGRGPASLAVADLASQATIELSLPEPRTLTVRVEDPQGRWPMRCSATVRTVYEETWERTSDPTRLAYYEDVDGWDGPHAADQTFKVPTLAPLMVDIAPPPGWAVLPRRAVLPPDVDHVAFRLVPSSELHVTVLDDSTGMAPDASTSISVAVHDLGIEHLVWNYGTTRGNEFQLHERLTPGRYEITVTADGYLPSTEELEFRSQAERADLVIRLEPRHETEHGPVWLRIVDDTKAPDAVRALARSGAPENYIDQYVVFLRATGTVQWINAHETVRPDGRIELRPHLLDSRQRGVRPGTYDLYVAKRDTGTAAFLPGIRVYGGQENEYTVPLQPGSFFSVHQLPLPEERLTKLVVRTTSTGELPLIHWSKDGHSTLSTTEHVGELLRVPLQPRIVGPFPAQEIEILVENAEGETRTVHVQGAAILR